MNWIKKHQLYCDIHYAIETCITGLSSKQEPDYITALVTRLPSKLSSILGVNIMSVVVSSIKNRVQNFATLHYNTIKVQKLEIS